MSKGACGWGTPCFFFEKYQPGGGVGGGEGMSAVSRCRFSLSSSHEFPTKDSIV